MLQRVANVVCNRPRFPPVLFSMLPGAGVNKMLTNFLATLFGGRGGGGAGGFHVMNYGIYVDTYTFMIARETLTHICILLFLSS